MSSVYFIAMFQLFEYRLKLFMMHRHTHTHTLFAVVFTFYFNYAISQIIKWTDFLLAATNYHQHICESLQAAKGLQQFSWFYFAPQFLIATCSLISPIKILQLIFYALTIHVRYHSIDAQFNYYYLIIEDLANSICIHYKRKHYLGEAICLQKKNITNFQANYCADGSFWQLTNHY